MASNWSALKIQLMGTGENSGTWGNVTNNNLGDDVLGEAITGSADVTFASNNQTLTASNNQSSQIFRNLRLNLTGTTGGTTRTLTVPNIEKVYIVNNGCGDAVEVKNSSGVNVSVPANKTTHVFSTGAGVVDAITYLSSLTLGSTLPAASGGTGINAAGSAGNVLTSTGSAWASTAIPSQFFSGMIILWSGAIIAIPSGWVLCDGTNSTPDLRDKFVVGAGSTYAVGATGGSPNAIVVSHTHTATSTSTVTDPGHQHGEFVGSLAMVSSAATGPIVSGAIVSASVSTNKQVLTATQTTGVTVATTTTVDTAGTSGTNANLPPYYALAYIMKT
jgi:hypothetical protein